MNSKTEILILGIDPGSRYTGYGIIGEIGSTQRCIVQGRIQPKAQHTADRLHEIYQQLHDIIHTYQPDEAAIEQVFFHVNAQSALKLGQARGAALVAAASMALPVTEYSAKQIKQAAVGYGAARKDQVQHMITSLLKLTEKPEADAADALAIALCHCHTRRLARTLAVALSSESR